MWPARSGRPWPASSNRSAWLSPSWSPGWSRAPTTWPCGACSGPSSSSPNPPLQPEALDEVGHPRTSQDRPDRLPLADPPLHRPPGRGPLCARRPGLGRGRDRSRPLLRRPRRRVHPPRRPVHLRGPPRPLPARRRPDRPRAVGYRRGGPGRGSRRPAAPGARPVRLRRPVRLVPAADHHPLGIGRAGMTSASPPEPATPAPAGAPSPPPPADRVGLWPLVGYFLTLGTIGFGGPVALTGYMHRDLVEQRRWFSEEEYKEGLALAQLAPGPLAAQLAIYLGYVRHGLLGATLVGLAFPAPSFAIVLAAGWAYVSYQGLDWLQALFYGVGAAVIAIIAHQATKLTRRTLGRDRLLAAIFLVVAMVTVVTESENGLLILAAGVLVWLVRARPRRLRLPRPGRGLAAL